jgi:hypothetical protein
MRLYKSIKIKGHNKYRAPIPKRRMQISADLKMSIVEHKGRWVIAFVRGWEHEFNGCDTLNKSDALKALNFLCDYLNLVAPNDVTILNASMRARTRGLLRDAEKLTAVAALKDSK